MLVALFAQYYDQYTKYTVEVNQALVAAPAAKPAAVTVCSIAGIRDYKMRGDLRPIRLKKLDAVFSLNGALILSLLIEVSNHGPQEPVRFESKTLEPVIIDVKMLGPRVCLGARKIVK